jgi:hypothetical protein
LKLIEILEQKEADLRLDEKSEDGVIGKLRYTFIVGDVVNSNKRRYGADILSKAIEDFKNGLKEKNVAGQLNHPVIGSHTELDKISHVITDVTFDKKSKKGIATSAVLDTSKGRDLKVLIDNSIPLGASVRGRGELDSQGNVMDDYKLLSIDLVSAPSYGADTMIDKSNLIESANSIFEKTLTENQKLELRFEHAKSAGYRGDFPQFKEEMEK